MSEKFQVEPNKENSQLKTDNKQTEHIATQACSCNEHIATQAFSWNEHIIQICSDKNSLYYPNYEANHKYTPFRYDINGGLVRGYCYTHGDKNPSELYDSNIEPMCYFC